MGQHTLFRVCVWGCVRLAPLQARAHPAHTLFVRKETHIDAAGAKSPPRRRDGAFWFFIPPPPRPRPSPTPPLAQAHNHAHGVLGRARGVPTSKRNAPRSPLTPTIPHPPFPPQIRFLILFSRQGKVRLSKWYVTLPPKERGALTREVTSTILARPPRACSVLEVADFKVSVVCLGCVRERGGRDFWANETNKKKPSTHPHRSSTAATPPSTLRPP